MERRETATSRKVAVLFGGRSVEHAISVITALGAIDALDPVAWSSVPVYVTPKGRWFTGETLLDPKFYVQRPQPVEDLTEVVLLPVPGVGGLSVVRPSRIATLLGRPAVIPIDVYLPVFHGEYGEDGAVQGLFELASVAYTGSRVLAAATGMNKHFAKLIAKANGIPVLPSMLITRGEVRAGLSAVRTRIENDATLGGFPFFVKPCSRGSSVGVGIASDSAELGAALDQALMFDAQVLVEPCLSRKREINVAVFRDEEVVASVIEEPTAAGTLGYREKYLVGGGKKKAGGESGSAGMASASRRIDPETFLPGMKEEAREYARRIYSALDCAGVARVDFLVDEGGKVHFNEINTLPGSLAYYLWAESTPRILYTELLDRMLRRALRDFGERAGEQHEFGFEALKPLLKP